MPVAEMPRSFDFDFSNARLVNVEWTPDPLPEPEPIWNELRGDDHVLSVTFEFRSDTTAWTSVPSSAPADEVHQLLEALERDRLGQAQQRREEILHALSSVAFLSHSWGIMAPPMPRERSFFSRDVTSLDD